MGQTRIKDVDKGLKKCLETLSKTKQGIVRVGVLADKGGSEAKTQNSALSVLDVAIFNEFGLGVPERSFIRAYVDENKAKIQTWIRVLAKQIADGKLEPKQALEQLGLKVQGGIQARIAKGVPPPNAEATIRRKGSSKPLIDTGQLRSSITYQVDSK